VRRSAFIGDFSALERQQRILDEDALADETVAPEPVSAGKIPRYYGATATSGSLRIT